MTSFEANPNMTMIWFLNCDCHSAENAAMVIDKLGILRRPQFCPYCGSEVKA